MYNESNLAQGAIISLSNFGGVNILILKAKARQSNFKPAIIIHSE